MVRLKHIIAFVFVTSLLFFGYNLFVFVTLSRIDTQFQINTRFTGSDLNDWLAPQRETLLFTRSRQNRTSDNPQSALKPTVLNACLLSENPCVEMLQNIAPARIFWKTATDILIEKHAIEQELFKVLKSGKLKDYAGKKITLPEQFIKLLQLELNQLEQALEEIPWYYRFSCRWYNLWNYTPLTLFTFLHYSHLIAALPDWIKQPCNNLISWYMKKHYDQMKEDTKKIIKKKTFRLFHWIVESRVEKTFKKIQKKAEKHSYIHDYSPYYRKLRYDFDLEIKNIYEELVRLQERNKALQEILLPAA